MWTEFSIKYHEGGNAMFATLTFDRNEFTLNTPDALDRIEALIEQPITFAFEGEDNERIVFTGKLRTNVEMKL